MRLYNRE